MHELVAPTLVARAPFLLSLLNGGNVIFNWNRELSAIVLEKMLGKLETF
jgi:hypothetical protein